ncbi:hypothetical protein [Clostridium oryzae]|uniref:Uncharacterized protein n=1 Tax=Clostridium oryzae TaxID=1450648 RepID=A0A1V4IIE5_9CLOT|nr:hypothetical protein [Clostridium oryzae]OPJ59778.1 hypothetical protein CLORY_31230 [Clostridium oryzae]
MIAVATGMEQLDKQIQQKFCERGEESKIVNYKEFFLKENFDMVILSKHLKGELQLEQLIFYLKNNNSRIIFLTGKSNNEEIYLCFKYAIYDMIFDPISLEKVMGTVDDSKSFSDHSKLFVEVMNGEKINRDKKAVLREVMSKLASKEPQGRDSEQENMELEEIKQLRVREKRQFEQNINELKKKLVQEERKPAAIKVVEKTIKQQVIAFWTANNNFLKEKVLANVSLLLAKRSDQKILLIDLSKDSMLESLLEGEKHNKEIEKHEVSTGFYEDGKIDIKKEITSVAGIKNLYVFKKVEETYLSKEQYYRKVIEWSKENFDTLIINMPLSIEKNEIMDAILRKCTYFIVVLEGKLPVIKLTENKLQQLRNKIDDSKIKLVLADTNIYSFKEFSKIIKNQIISRIQYDFKEEKFINEQKQFIFSTECKKNIKSYQKILEYFGYVPRTSLIKSLLNKIY